MLFGFLTRRNVITLLMGFIGLMDDDGAVILFLSSVFFSLVRVFIFIEVLFFCKENAVCKISAKTEPPLSWY